MRARVPTLLAPTSAGDDWRDRAACRDEDPELFFPTAESDSAAYAPAILVCTRCPARAECLEWALQTGQEWGTWGGTTPMTRREIRRGRRRGGVR